MHSTIECVKRGINIFHPFQWEVVMQFACKSKPYNVRVLNQEEIYNLITQLGSVYSNLIIRKTDRYQGQPSQSKLVKSASSLLTRPSRNKIKMLYNYDLTTPFPVAVMGNLKKPNTRRSWSYDTNLDIPKVCSGTLAVNPMLKKDLLQLCHSNAIPPQCHSFYESLLTGTVMCDDPDYIDPDHESGGSDSDTESNNIDL